MNFGFKLRLQNIAETLIDKGFESRDIDSDTLVNEVLEILQNDYDLFTAIGEEMQKIEERGNFPKTKADYDESIGEF